MNEEYVFQLDRMFFPFDRFKEKFTGMFINTVTGTRIGRVIKFKAYCTAEFEPEDYRYEFPHIKECEKFNRLKTNCLEFDVVSDECEYNKVFVYHSVTSHKGIKPTGFYNLIFYNTETKKMLQIPSLQYNIEAIVKGIQLVTHS